MIPWKIKIFEKLFTYSWLHRFFLSSKVTKQPRVCFYSQEKWLIVSSFSFLNLNLFYSFNYRLVEIESRIWDQTKYWTENIFLLIWIRYLYWTYTWSWIWNFYHKVRIFLYFIQSIYIYVNKISCERFAAAETVRDAFNPC